MRMVLEKRACLVACVALASCSVGAGDSDSTVEGQILAEAEHYAEAWNRGDLEVIAATHHPSYVHVTPDGPLDLVTRMSSVEARHTDGTDRGTLSFHDMTVRPLGDDYALAYGRARLVFVDGTDTSSWFTSAYVRTATGWLAILDAG